MTDLENAQTRLINRLTSQFDEARDEVEKLKADLAESREAFGLERAANAEMATERDALTAQLATVSILAEMFRGESHDLQGASCGCDQCRHLRAALDATDTEEEGNTVLGSGAILKAPKQPTTEAPDAVQEAEEGSDIAWTAALGLDPCDGVLTPDQGCEALWARDERVMMDTCAALAASDMLERDLWCTADLDAIAISVTGKQWPRYTQEEIDAAKLKANEWAILLAPTTDTEETLRAKADVRRSLGLTTLADPHGLNPTTDTEAPSPEEVKAFTERFHKTGRLDPPLAAERDASDKPVIDCGHRLCEGAAWCFFGPQPKPTDTEEG